MEETLRRGINGAARFKFQISPRQMPLGKEQFVFAVAGGGRQGRALAAPHSQKLQPAHSAWSDTATVWGPSPLQFAKLFPRLHNLTSCSSLGARQGCTFPSHGVGGSER